ncbi:translation elongation factor 4 [Patescibacteria group bacterium]|nr:translation elongation factor 4 [Patescibacteria group bacterium]
MDQDKIRNFCIIAHIDHGKSTLADRMLELTGTVEKRKMKKQLLDSMELEQEKGITIKLAPARMKWSCKSHVANRTSIKNDARLAISDEPYTLNLIDTPGHVDFNYEVSRSLAAVDGAILLVDATQGVQAQTIGNLYLALEQNLAIIPVLNKIDLPAADVKTRTAEIANLIGCDEKDVLTVSAKTGEGVDALLDAVVEQVPSPVGDPAAPPRALVFDSFYDEYKGVVAYVRLVDGSLKKGETFHMMATKEEDDILEVGALVPTFSPTAELATGQIGYVVTGQKDIEGVRVGDTMTVCRDTKSCVPTEVKSLPGYKEVKPMVFAGIFPKEGNEYNRLRESIAKLKMQDAALTYEPEQSSALGFGLRCGFLGMLHLEIIKERLVREFDLELVVTVPSVAYKVIKTGGATEVIKSALDLPDAGHIEHIEEPWVNADLVAPKEHIGAIMQLCTERRAIYKNTEFLEGDRSILHYEMPLASIIIDFYDKLKTVTAGYGSLNYEVTDYRPADVVRMDILVAEEPVEALSTLVYRDEAHTVGKAIVNTLKDAIPRTMFVIKLQAAIGGKIVASERISAMRKDVTAKLYGGDVTRKRKLLEKQKKGKAKMAAMGKGKVDIPTDAYLKVLKR